MSKGLKVLIGLGILFILIALFGIAFHKTPHPYFQPQNDFKLADWVPIKLGSLNLSITKAVVYLLFATVATTATMTYVARRMVDRPNRVQTAVEGIYGMIRDNIAGPNNIERRLAQRWFPFIATLFLFIWFSNLVGYIPLPMDTDYYFNLFGLHIPGFAIYAATANISVTLALTLVVVIGYHFEGVRRKGLRRYVKGWLPGGLDNVPARAVMIPIIFSIEVISQFVRIISLSVRLFANILAGHLLILFMGGGLVILLGFAWLGVLTFPLAVIFFLFEIVLIATLQAFIFATLTAIYLGGAVAESH